MDNNLSGISTQKNNNINQFQTDAMPNTQEKVNFNFANVVKDEVRSTQEEALTNVLSGAPTPDLTVAETTYTQQPTLTIDSHEVTDKFTTRQEVMSQLHLMDENGNYTDTYTNYINNGGSPLPGYEQAHQEILSQERYEKNFERYNNGEISYEDALMQSYGTDILESMGYKVKSVGWWMSKYLSHDYSNPSDNRYIMDQVLKEAQNYHESRLASEWANKDTKDTQLATLVGQDLEYTQIKDIFNLDPLKDDLDERDFMRALHTGSISAMMRITQDSEGNYYYLHTDGELYKLDGQSGENHGTLKTDANGNFVGIDLNNSAVGTTARSLWTGFEGVFHGIVDLGITAVNTIDALVPVFSCWSGDFGVWDGVESEDFIGWANTYDAWLNDNASWLVDNGYVDLDANHISGQDAANFVASMIGTIAGTMTLAGAIGSVGDGVTGAKGLTGWGEALIKEGHSVTGKIIKGTGAVLKWQTGNLGTNYGTVAHVEGAGKAIAGVWLRRAGGSAVANTKNFINDWRKMYVQSKLYEDGATEGEIFGRAFTVGIVNTLIDTAISGGMDDNQWQAITGRDTFTDYTKAKNAEARNTLAELLSRQTSDKAKQALTEVQSKELKNFLTQRGLVIALNSGMDLLGNLATGAIQQNAQLDENGKIASESVFTDVFKNMFSGQNLARSAINTLWYSTRGQIKEWNVGLEVVGSAHQGIMNDFDDLIKNTKDADTKATYAKIKADYIKNLKESDKPTYEGKILDAWDKLSTNLGKVPDVIKDNVMGQATIKNKAYYDALWKNAEIMYAAQVTRMESVLDPEQPESKKIFKDMIGKVGKLYKKLTGLQGRDINVLKAQSDEVAFNKQIQEQYETLFCNNYEVIENLNNNIVKLKGEDPNNKNTKGPLLTKAGITLKEENPELFSKLLEKDKESINKTYFILPNQSDRTADYYSSEAGLRVLTQLGYIKVADEDNGVYEIQRYTDGVDFLNTSLVTEQVYLSIKNFALMKNKTDAESEHMRTTIMNDLMNTLVANNSSINEKTELVSQLLYTMCDPSEENGLRNVLTTKQAHTLIKELQDAGQIQKFSTSKGKSMTTNQALDFFRSYGECLTLLIKNKGSQIDISDPNNRAVLEAMTKGKDAPLSKSSYNALLKVQENNQDFFDNGNPLNKKEAYVKKMLTKMFSDVGSQNKEKYTPEEIDKQIRLYFTANGLEDNDENVELYKHINELAKAYDNIYKNTKTATITDDDIVYINLATFQGKNTSAMLKDLQTRLENNTLSSDDVLTRNKYAKRWESEVNKELSFARETKRTNGNVLTFDLNTDSKLLIDILNGYGYDVNPTANKDSLKKTLSMIDQKAVKNYRGDLIVLDVPQGDIKAIQDALKLKEVKLKVNGKTQTYNFINRTVKDINGYEWGTPDYYKAIMDSVDIHNIDPSLVINLKALPFMQIMPFKPNKNGKYTFSESIEVALLSDNSKNLRKLAGKTASQTEQAFSAVFSHEVGAEAKIDKNLESYFILDMMATRLTEAHRMHLPVTKEEIQILKANGLVDTYKGNSKTQEDTPGVFWRLTKAVDGKASLELKPNVTKEDLRNYIISKDFNFFKMFPLLLTDSEQAHGMLSAYEDISTAGQNDMPKGMAQEGINALLKFDLPWDDEENTRFRQFLLDIKEAAKNTDDLKFTPFDGKVDYTLDKAEYNDFESWNKATKNSKNPYDILLHRYYEEFQNMIKGKAGQEKYNNETLLIKPKFSQQTLLQAVLADEKPSEELVNKIKEDMKFSFEPNGNQSDVSSNITETRGVYARDPHSAGSLILDKTGSSVGGLHNVDIKSPDGSDSWIDIDTVTAAYNAVKDIVNRTDNEYRMTYDSNYLPIDFTEDPVTKIYQLGGESDGHIAIQDIDEWADALFDWTKQLSDNPKEAPQQIVRPEAHAAMLNIFGKGAQKAEDEIFKQASKFLNLQNKLFVTEKRATPSYALPSIKLDTQGSDGEDIQGTRASEDNTQFLNFNDLLTNSLKNKEIKNEDKTFRLSDITNTILDNELEQLQKNIETDRLLTTSSPMDSIVSNLSIRNNQMGMMHTAINTYQKLLEGFDMPKNDSARSKAEENLMRTAITLVNSHVGVDYAGETMDYFIINKDGSIRDLDSLGSANYQDLLYNISKYEKDLIGCTVLKANTQGIENTAGLQMEQLKLTKNNYSEFVTDLWANLVYSNQRAWQRYQPDGTEKFMDNLVTHMPKGTELQRILEQIPAQRYSSIQKTRMQYEIFKDRSQNYSLTPQQFNAIVKGVTVLDLLPQAQQAIKSEIGRLSNLTDEAFKNNMSFKQIVDLSFGISPDHLDSDVEQILSDLKEDFKTKALGEPKNIVSEMLDTVKDYETDKEFEDRAYELLKNYSGSDEKTLRDIERELYLKEKQEGRKLSQQEKLKTIIVNALLSKNDSPAIDTFVRNRSLTDMRNAELEDNIKNGFYIDSVNDNPILSDTKPLTDLVESLRKNDGTNNSQYTKIISLDTETDLMNKHDIFSIGIYVKEFKDGKWEDSHYTIYLNKAAKNANPSTIQATIDKWLKDNSPENHTFVVTNEGYRKERDTYKNILAQSNDTDTLFLRPDKAQEFMYNLFGAKDNTLLIGYNSANADIPWLIKNGILKEDIRNSVTHIDEMLLLNASQNIKAKGKAGLEERAAKADIPVEGAHGSMQDARTTMRLFEKAIDYSFNINSMRNYEYRYIDNILKAYYKDNYDSVVESQDYIKTLEEIDNALYDARQNSKINKYFDPNYSLNPSSVLAASDLLEYVVNRKLNDYVTELNKLELKDVALDKVTSNYLESNSWKRMGKLWTYAKEQGVTEQKFIDSLRECTGYPNNMNALLYTMSSEQGLTDMMTKLGLNAEDFDEDKTAYTPIFGTTIDPSKADFLDEESRDRYNKYGLYQEEIKGFRKIKDALGLSDDMLAEDLLNDIATFYDVNEDLDIEDVKNYFKTNAPYIRTRSFELWKEQLDNDYGDADALFATNKKGVYELVNSLDMNSKIKDMLTNKVVMPDSQDVAISKKLFEQLVHMPVDKFIEENKELIDENGGIYSQFLVHPADNNFKIIPRRIRVVDTEENFVRAPETVLEVLGARDLDGDHLALLAPDRLSQKMLSTYSNDIFKIHNVQENMLSTLRKLGVYSDNTQQEQYIYNKLGRDQEVIKACERANDALKNNDEQELEAAEKDFNKALDNIYVDGIDEDIKNKAKELLWIKEVIPYEETKDAKTKYRFIQNPATLWKDNELTESGKIRLDLENLGLINKTYFAYIDQSTGMVQKGMKNVFKPSTVKNPWTDLLISNIYGSELVYKHWKNIDGSNYKDIDKITQALSESIKNIYPENLYGESKEYSTISNKLAKLDKDIAQVGSLLKENKNLAAFNLYNDILINSERILRENLNPERLMADLTSDEMLEHYSNMRHRIDGINKAVALRNELYNANNIYPNDYDSQDLTMYTIRDAVNKLSSNGTTEYNYDVWGDQKPTKVFVITKGDTSGIGADVILYNKDTINRRAAYTKAVYTIGKSDILENLPIKDKDTGMPIIYPKGTLIAYNKNNPDDTSSQIRLEHPSAIIGTQGNKLIVESISPFDSQLKGATNTGAKGVIDASYGIVTKGYNDVAFLLQHPNPLKTLGNDASQASDIKKIQIKTADGETKTVYGYIQDNVKFKTVENTKEWNKYADRKIDYLHFISDAYSINGLLNGRVFYDEDNNKLTVDPTYIKEGTDAIFKRYKVIQGNNKLPVYNKMKFAFILNNITDDELLKAFNTDMNANDLRRNLLYNNIALGTSKYTNMAQALGNTFKNKSWFKNADPIIQNLFNDSSWVYLNNIIQTASEDTDYTQSTSKRTINQRANKAMYSVGNALQFTKDELDTMKDFTSWETGGYLSPTKFFNIIFNNNSPFNSYRIGQLMTEGKLPIGRFKPDSGTMYNNYRNANVKYISDKIVPDGHIGSGLAKTANVASRAIPTSNKFLNVDLTVPNKNEISNEQYSPTMDPGFLTLILGDEDPWHSNSMRTAYMLKSLEMLKDSQTLAQKIENLSNDSNTYRTKDIHYSIIPDEKGMWNIVTDSSIDRTGTLRELKNSANSSLYNYSTWKATNTDKAKTVSQSFLEDTVKKEKARELVSNYNRGIKQTHDALDSLEVNLKNDFFDKRTGEISKVKDIKGYDTNSDIKTPEVLSGGNESIIKESVWGRQGLNENDPFNAQMSTAMKRVAASQIASEQEMLFKLNNLVKIRDAELSKEEYETYNHYRAIYAEYSDESYRASAEAHLKEFGIDSIKTVVDYLNNFRMQHTNVEIAYNNFEKAMTELANAVREETGEPASTIGFMMCPYKSTFPEQNVKTAYSVLHKIYNQYDPLVAKSSGALSTVYDFDNSMKSIIKELSAMHASRYMSQELKDQNLLDNKKLMNDVIHIIDETITNATHNEKKDLKDWESDVYVSEKGEQGKINQEIKTNVFSFVSQLTGMTIDEASWGGSTTQQYKSLFDNVSYRLSAMIDEFNQKHNTNLSEYTDFNMLQYSTTKPYELKHEAKVISDFYYAKIVCMQGMLDSSYNLSNKLKDTMNSLRENGYSFVNKYGQKYVRNGIVAPLSSTSLSFLKENLGIAYNSSNEQMWNQFLMQKVMSGELYLMKDDVANYLDKHQYTHKIGNQTINTLKKISKWSAALQMALPSKILNRVISFTGFDYTMGMLYDPHVIKYIGPARRELLAAYQSKGTQMSDELREYMEREGQPIGLTGKDPITFSESMDAKTKAGKAVEAVLDKLTDPLEFQNHLGRYAIYRAALEGFQEGGKPWYGIFYSKKDAIDSLRTPEDKAMYVMDYMLGSPGGFPELARKTSGVMMYATFPLNFSRTLGAWGMSMGKLFHEGFTAENSKYWAQAAFVPAVGAASITGLVALINSWICDLLGVDEKGKEDIVKSLATLDPIGTIIGGTPTKSSSSMNPVTNAKEMFIEPFTNENNDTIFKKIYGLVNANIISHFNPAIKNPLEMITGYDLFSSAPIDTKHQYTAVENGERKVLGFLVGSNVANNVIMQNKIDKYSSDSSFVNTLGKGIARGVQESLGNQKTYKKDTSNYYNQIYALNNYRYKTSEAYDPDWEDYTVADEMEKIRNSSSKYGTFNSDDYKRISKLLRKMMNNKEEPATVYSMIAQEYQNGVSEVTLKTVLNNNSIVRKLRQVDTETYLNTLSTKQYKELMKAVEYENTFYPMLQEFFPTKESTSKYNKTYYHKDYIPSVGGSSYVSRPKSYYPNYNNNYSYKKTYYNKYKKNYKFDNNVKVSPQMGIWDNNYNEVKFPKAGGN